MGYGSKTIKYYLVYTTYGFISENIPLFKDIINYKHSIKNNYSGQFKTEKGYLKFSHRTELFPQ